MTVKAALMMVFGFLLGMLGSWTAAIEMPLNIRYDDMQMTTRILGNVMAIAGLILFAIGALTSRK